MSDTKMTPAEMQAVFGPYCDEGRGIDARSEDYRRMIGFLPPRVEARLNVTGALDPQVLALQEKLRERALNPACFDAKTVQLLTFGILIVELSDAAVMHGCAARRAGATWEELQAVINLCSAFRGLPAANRGAEVLVKVAQRERS
jgi:alkylhydroperoxidase/carboxymuconolactone decarboxylase family protein YurZ